MTDWLLVAVLATGGVTTAVVTEEACVAVVGAIEKGELVDLESTDGEMFRVVAASCVPMCDRTPQADESGNPLPHERLISRQRGKAA